MNILLTILAIVLIGVPALIAVGRAIRDSIPMGWEDDETGFHYGIDPRNKNDEK